MEQVNEVIFLLWSFCDLNRTGVKMTIGRKNCLITTRFCDAHIAVFQLKMSGKLPLVLVASLALVSLAAAHSIEKRQTTVSKSACLYL